MNRIWITWEFQRRNIGISASLGWELVQLESEAPRLRRYLLLLWKTFTVVKEKRPEVIAVQNPSIVLAVFAVFLSSVFRSKLVIDAHNSGIYPSEGQSFLLMGIANWLQEKADLVIVTNETLKAVVESHNGRSFVLPDKISDPPSEINDIELEGNFNVVFICTYSSDEPYSEVIKAASLLSDDIVIYITGGYQNKVNPDDVPANVRLLGFVAESDYWSFLKSSDVVMDLTLREDCLVCGAYESVALGKPLILSNSKALRSYFNAGCVYVDSSVQSIVSGILEAEGSIMRLQRDILTLRETLQASWSAQLGALCCEIDSIVYGSLEGKLQ